MKIVVINCGSSTVKFDYFESAAHGPEDLSRLAHGAIDHIGRDAQLSVRAASGATLQRDIDASDHRAAVEQALFALAEITGGGRSLDALGVEAVGHRVVHGGSRFVQPTLIDSTVLSALVDLDELAPLHNPAATAGILAARDLLGNNVPMVAVFDTAFHSTLPELAYTYALPRHLAERLGIRRYGFHGTAHEYMLKQYSQVTGIQPRDTTIITLQLGNGCSATAIKQGRSVDTSMGFTPLEGLVMGTRSGDLDPGLISYLSQKENVSAGEVDLWLNEKSGLLGISGSSADMRTLLAAQEHDAAAALAIEVFSYRVKRYIGSYLAVLGSAQAVIFGGGIGENSPYIRSRACEGLEWCGLQLDPARNAAAVGTEASISADGSGIKVHVIQVDEALLIAQHTLERLGSDRLDAQHRNTG